VIIREEGDLLLVSHGVRLGDVCLKCATREGVGRRFELMRHRDVWATVKRAGPLIVYCGFASALLTWLVPGLPWGTLGGLIALVILARSWSYGAVDLPICAPCNARWRGVLRSRSLVMLSLVPLAVLSAIALDLDAHGARLQHMSSWLVSLAGLAWVAVLVALHMGKWRHRMIWARAIHPQLIFLRGVHPDARRALVVEAAAAAAVRRLPAGP
jgi:hypothetical protein